MYRTRTSSVFADQVGRPNASDPSGTSISGLLGILRPVRIPRHPLLMARFGVIGLQASERVDRAPPQIKSISVEVPPRIRATADRA